MSCHLRQSAPPQRIATATRQHKNGGNKDNTTMPVTAWQRQRNSRAVAEGVSMAAAVAGKLRRWRWRWCGGGVSVAELGSTMVAVAAALVQRQWRWRPVWQRGNGGGGAVTVESAPQAVAGIARWRR